MHLGTEMGDSFDFFLEEQKQTHLSAEAWLFWDLVRSHLESDRNGPGVTLVLMGGTDEKRGMHRGFVLDFIMILFLYLTFSKNNIWMKESGHPVTGLVVAVHCGESFYSSHSIAQFQCWVCRRHFQRQSSELRRWRLPRKAWRGRWAWSIHPCLEVEGLFADLSSLVQSPTNPRSSPFPSIWIALQFAQSPQPLTLSRWYSPCSVLISALHRLHQVFVLHQLEGLPSQIMVFSFLEMVPLNRRVRSALLDFVPDHSWLI